ncbi:MAG: hypothetical protein QCH99_01985 [Candidatus Bathyarchaeota archaeon]|nr:hypothetical protein [Candidatus Bathyarchaeum tardum]WGM89189.1 MAG: hypothetical protein NUK63_09800 [Candidatus Bathyarchaeum tardum]
MRKQTITSIMDVLISADIKNQSIDGYDVICYIYETFSVMISSGVVYSLLILLE